MKNGARYVGTTHWGAFSLDGASYIEAQYGYDLSRSCDEIRPSYHHVESCQKTAP